MKVIVKEIFNDKYTGALYKPGDILEITDTRFAEIKGVGDFIEPAPVPPVEDEAPVEPVKSKTRKAAKKADG